MIWHDPGFPSFLVTYHVANDFFFSGHTAIAVFGAIELSRMRRNLADSRSGPACLVRGGYGPDLARTLHHGCLCRNRGALWVAHLSERISPLLDQLIAAKS